MNGFLTLRDKRILHRDFKLANIFMHEDRLIIGDFGFAKQGAEIASTMVGTPVTMAPEILFYLEENNKVYNSKADLWSIGIVFYQLLFGVLPFNGNSIPQLCQNINKVLKTGLTFPKPISVEAKNLLNGLLQKDPKSRIEWKDFFNHPVFFTRENSDIRIIKKAFGAMGVANASEINYEFQKNVNRENLKEEVDFRNPHEIEPSSNHYKGVEAEETQMNNKETMQQMKQTCVKEIFFRYNHELNKVYFFSYFVHKIQKLQKNAVYEKVAPIGLGLSLLLIMKASSLNQVLYQSCKNNPSAYNIMPEYFEYFNNSEMQEKIKDLTKKNQKAISDHFGLLRRRQKENSITLSCESLLSSKTEVREIDVGLKSELNKLLEFMPSSHPNEENIARNYVLFQYLKKIVHNFDNFFSYLTTSDRDVKFNWNRFYYLLERGTTEEIKNNI